MDKGGRGEKEGAGESREREHGKGAQGMRSKGAGDLENSRVFQYYF